MPILAPVQWLRRMRVKRRRGELLSGKDKVAEIGFGAGLKSESVFHRQFLGQMRMTPGAYRALDGAQFHVANAVRLPGQGNSRLSTPAIPRASASAAKAIASGRRCTPRMVRRGRNRIDRGGVGESACGAQAGP